MKKVGIIGSGQVAQTLGAGFVKNGFQVMLGTRDAVKLSEWQAEQGANAQIGSFVDAANFGDLIVLAAKGTIVQEIVSALKKELSNKTVIDACNPISDTAPTNGVLNFFTNMNKSLMEELQETVPTAKFVKAFSSVGSPFMVNPPFAIKPTMFICGNSDEAKKEVSDIIELFGWEASDFGKVESARAIEPLCMLWCVPGLLKNEWTHAFKLVKL